MKWTWKWFFLNRWLAAAALTLTLTSGIQAEISPPVRQLISADLNWKFLLGDPAGAEAADFNDASWRTVNLPHDWSIEGQPDRNSPSGAGEGYFPAGVGWYRKTFTAPASWNGKRISVDFDGVYMDATVYLNGQKLGHIPTVIPAFVSTSRHI